MAGFYIEFDRPIKCPYCGCTSITRQGDVDWGIPTTSKQLTDVRCECKSCATSFTIHVDPTEVRSRDCTKR